MTIPNKYITGAESLTTFDHSDIASGTGKEDFYAGNVSGAYLMSSNVFYSHNVFTEAALPVGAVSLVHDLDFDVDFNLPRTVKGKTLINIPIAIYGETSSKISRIRADVHIRKWDGTAETEIINASGAQLELETTGVNQYKRAMDNIEVDIPLTHFKKGETLRLTIMGYGGTASASVAHMLIGHDPQNRGTGGWDVLTFNTEPTTLIFQVPFRIDV